MAINYTPEFNRKIRRILDNYNKKVNRLQSKGVSHVPPKITARGLKSAYENRNQLEARLKQLQNFNREKLRKTVLISADNVKTNKYEYETFRLNQRVAKTNIKRLLDKNIERDKREGRFLPSQRTRSLKAQLKTLEKTDKKRFSYQTFLASKRIAKRYTELRHESDQQFYENFFDMLWSNQVYAEIDPDLVEQAHNMLEELTPEQLLEMYNNEPDISRLVEDYNLYVDTQGYSLSDTEVIRARVRFEMLMDELPDLIKKYKKF